MASIPRFNAGVNLNVGASSRALWRGDRKTWRLHARAAEARAGTRHGEFQYRPVGRTVMVANPTCTSSLALPKPFECKIGVGEAGAVTSTVVRASSLFFFVADCATRWWRFVACGLQPEAATLGKELARSRDVEPWLRAYVSPPSTTTTTQTASFLKTGTALLNRSKVGELSPRFVQNDHSRAASFVFLSSLTDYCKYYLNIISCPDWLFQIIVLYLTRLYNVCYLLYAIIKFQLEIYL